MASILFPQPLLFLLLNLLYYTTASPIPSLLAFNCTPPPLQPIKLHKFTKLIFDNLTAEATKTRFTTITVGVEPDRVVGLMQCRLDLSPTNCSLCVRTAKHVVSSICPNSEAATAWYDGCYVHYYNHSKFSRAIQIPTLSRSNKTYVMDQAWFNSALDTLLLQLRAAVNLASHQGFSQGEILYGNSSSRVYGVAECIRSASPKECDVCVGEGIKKLQECCSGKIGGLVVAGYCVVRFESYKFFSYVSESDSGGGSDISYDESESESESESVGLKVKVVWTWGALVVCCLIGVVLGAWLLRREVVNIAKVVVVSDEDSGGGPKLKSQAGD